MSDFKTLKGLFIKHVSSDPANPIHGQIWYNTTTQSLKGSITIEAWAAGGNMASTRRNHGGTGIQTSALAFGGFGDNPTVNFNHTEEYDGSSWTETANLGTARRGPEGFGTQTASVANGGFPPPGKLTEEYNGSAWTSGNASNTARTNRFGTAGTLTAGLIFSGSASVNTESYDGTNWTEVANLSTAAGNTDGTGTSTAAICTGGDATGTLQVQTEEWDGSSWTSGGDLITAIQQHGTFGPSTQAYSVAGDNASPAVTAVVELYNGTSWVLSPSLATARNGGSTAGATSPAIAGLFGGGFPGSGAGINSTEEFDSAVTTRTWDTT